MKKWEQGIEDPDDELADVPLTDEEFQTFPRYFGVNGLPEEAKNAVLQFIEEAKERKKKAISVRLDQDIIDWLKSSGDAYQTRLNAILRQAMLKDLAGK
jgi:uncharacterized protein (DUF4415 family)